MAIGFLQSLYALDAADGESGGGAIVINGLIQALLGLDVCSLIEGLAHEVSGHQTSTPLPSASATPLASLSTIRGIFLPPSSSSTSS